PRELQPLLRTHIEQDSARLAGVMPDLGSPRRQLIAAALLRVNGSMPTYAIRVAVPNDLSRIVAGTGGNCADFTVRLMLLLEAIGVRASLISIVTPELPGHVFVDAYDPIDDTAY